MRMLTLILLTVCISAPATADYAISRSVLANGGGTAAGPANTVSCTLGQAAIGRSEGVDFVLASGFWYLPDQGASGIEARGDELPVRFALAPGAGNPMRSVTTLSFDVPQRSHVAIELYDIAGRRLRTLVDAVFEPGSHRADLDTAGLSSGIYFCRMRAEAFSQTRRFVLLQ